MQGVFGHMVPGVRAVDWVFFHISPLNYQLALAFLVIVFGLASLTFWVLLRLLFRPAPALLLFLLAFQLTAAWMPGLMWWAGGIQMFPCVLGAVLALLGLVLYIQGRPLAGLVAVAVGYSVALSTYEKGLLIPVAVLLLTIAVLPPRRWLSIWPVAAVLAVITVGYMAVYVGGQYSRPSTVPRQTLWLRYLWTAWADGFGSALLAGPFRWAWLGNLGIADPPGWLVVAGQLGVSAIVAAGIWLRGARSLLGWLFFAPLFLISAVLIGSGRLAIFGIGIAREYRYLSDLIPFFLLGAALAVLPRRGEALTAKRLRIPIPAVSLGVAAYAGLFVCSAVPLSEQWARNAAEAYVGNERGSLAAATAAGPVDLFDSHIPAVIMPADWYPYTMQREFAPLIDPQVHVGGPEPTHVVGDDGRLVPFSLDVQATAAPACAPAAGGWLYLNLDHPLAAGPHVLRLGYRSPRPMDIHLSSSPGAGWVDATGDRAPFHIEGSGVLLVQLRSAAVSAVRVEFDGSPGPCVTTLDMGSVAKG